MSRNKRKSSSRSSSGKPSVIPNSARPVNPVGIQPSALPSASRQGSRWLPAIGFLAVLVALAGGGWAWWKSSRPPALPRLPKPPSIALITLDTTRADRLSVYGGIAATPNLEMLAKEGVVFEHAYSSVPLTLPSHSSMMTGLFPHQHGARQNATMKLSDRMTTLAESLSGKGYDTGAFIGSLILSKRFGIAQGFQHFDDPFGRSRLSGRIPERPASAVVSKALEWYWTARDKPVFLWVHLYDAHHPHRPPEPFRSRYPQKPYEAEIAYMDSALAPLIQALKQSPDPMVILVAGDHGESLGEHNESSHGYTVYDSVLRVPFLVWSPRLFQGGRRLNDQVGLGSIFGTLLELSGSAMPTDLPQRAPSLVPALLGGPVPPSSIVVESRGPTDNYGTAMLKGLRTERWKWIDTPRPELYDLQSDPNESQNVFEKFPEVVADLSSDLDQLWNEGAVQEEIIELDAATRAALESLGYVGSSQSVTPEGEKLDPKDVMPLLPLANAAKKAMILGRFDESYALHGQILETCPTAIASLVSRGRAAVAMKDFGKAALAFEDWAKVNPEDPLAHYNLGVAELAQKRYAEARTALEMSLALKPDEPDTHYALGVVLLASEKKEEGREHLRKYLEMDPDGPDVKDAQKLLKSSDSSNPAQPSSSPIPALTPVSVP